MKVRITYAFHDKDRFEVVYPVGEVVEFENERAKRLIALGYAEAVKRSRKQDDN